MTAADPDLITLNALARPLYSALLLLGTMLSLDCLVKAPGHGVGGAPQNVAAAPRVTQVDLASADLASADLASADLAAPGLSRTFRYADINHVLSTGQSLAVGYNGTPVLSTAQPYANRMFNTGVSQAGGDDLSALIPLVEADVESMSSGMANLITRMAREELLLGQPPGQQSHDLLVSCHGIGGTDYAGLMKGTLAYENGLAQVRAGQALAQGAGQRYVVRAVTNVHGEADHIEGNTGYGTDLLAWQADYEADVQALTGQSEQVPMLHSQMSSWTLWGAATSLIPQAQLDASLQRPERLVLVGPKYFLPYSDGAHLTSEGYRWMGEYYAKAYRRVVLEGQAWSPLRPVSAQRAGAVVTLRFLVPRPPLVLDTALVTDPGQYGFEYADASGVPVPILLVALLGPDTVVLTLAVAASSGRVRYAFTGTPGQGAGPQTGPRGNLRDSDDARSRNGDPLYNWCVHFDLALPGGG